MTSSWHVTALIVLSTARPRTASPRAPWRRSERAAPDALPGEKRWWRDRGTGPAEELRREGGPARRRIRRRSWPGDRVPRSQRGREVDDHAPADGAGTATGRQRPHQRQGAAGPALAA